MNPSAIKMMKCFLLARQVNHFYWCHTSADEKVDGQWQVSLENLHRIVERMIQIPINKYRVDVVNPTVRGAYERYPDHIVIYVAKDEKPGWERFTAIKELCHALMDEPNEYSTDVINTIHELKEYSASDRGIHGLSMSGRTEKMSEIMAVELIYPIEYRGYDKKRREQGEPYGEIGGCRGVPASWVEVALDVTYDECADIWKFLDQFPVTQKLGPPVAPYSPPD